MNSSDKLLPWLHNDKYTIIHQNFETNHHDTNICMLGFMLQFRWDLEKERTNRILKTTQKEPNLIQIYWISLLGNSAWKMITDFARLHLVSSPCLWWLENLTLRSTFDRDVRHGPNLESFWIALHFPGPYFSTPARRAASSSAVHFCLGAPIAVLLLRPFFPVLGSLNYSPLATFWERLTPLNPSPTSFLHTKYSSHSEPPQHP